MIGGIREGRRKDVAASGGGERMLPQLLIYPRLPMMLLWIFRNCLFF